MFIINVGLAGDYISAYLRERTQDQSAVGGCGGHTVTRLTGAKFFTALDPRGLVIYALDLMVVGIAYFGLAYISLTVVSIHSGVLLITPVSGTQKRAFRFGRQSPNDHACAHFANIVRLL